MTCRVCLILITPISCSFLPSEPLWTTLTSKGSAPNCAQIGATMTVTSGFPDVCYSAALAVGADTIEATTTGNQCKLRRCRSWEEIVNFPNSNAQLLTTLRGGWHQILRADEGVGVLCQAVGTYALTNVSLFPAACFAQTIALGGDTFNVLPNNRSQCFVKKCGRIQDVTVTAAGGGFEAYTFLSGTFRQITTSADGVGTNCALLASMSISDPTTLPLACVSKTIAEGGDTFDVMADKSMCYVKKCSTFSTISFDVSLGPRDSFTYLGGFWPQLVLASEGVRVNCTDLGAFTIPDPTAFPLACSSQAVIRGADTFNVNADKTSCTFQRCGTFSEIRFTADSVGLDAYSLLGGGWTKLVSSTAAVGTTCETLGTLTLTPGIVFPDACASRAAKLGGDTFDADPNRTVCHLKKCGDWRAIGFTQLSGSFDCYTMLFPRSAFSDWGFCHPATCFDIKLLYTAELRGLQLPITAGALTCDPLASSACYGGNARRKTYIDAEKAKAAAEGRSVQTLDIGNFHFGGVLFDNPSYAYAKPASMLQNLVPYDMCFIGQSDFLIPVSNKTSTELPFSYKARTCPWVVSNMVMNNGWSILSPFTQRYMVKRMPNGMDVAFVGMTGHDTRFGYSFGYDVAEIDPNGELAAFLAGELPGVQALPAEFEREFAAADGEVNGLSVRYQDLFSLASHINVDALLAAQEAKRNYPNVKAMVLIVPKTDRDDEIAWMRQYGPFDAIVAPESTNVGVLGSNLFTGKTVVVAASQTQFGLGSLDLRIEVGKGIVQWEFKADMPMHPTIASNVEIVNLSNDFYVATRLKNTMSYGKITNDWTGGHRSGEVAPSKNQCYFTDCPGAEQMGKALLWKARNFYWSGGAQSQRLDVSFYNLGGFRAALRGDANKSVFKSMCTASFSFANRVFAYSMLGNDLYKMVAGLFKDGPAMMADGIRIAYYEPCYDYVNHSNYDPGDVSGAFVGPQASLDACVASGIESALPYVTDIEVRLMDYDNCLDWNNCDKYSWTTLEKGSTYVVVTTDFIAGSYAGLTPVDGVPIGTDNQAVCDYIAGNSPVQVKPWTDYRLLGSIQYETAAEGWAAGCRSASVKTSASIIQDAPICPDGKYLAPGALACEVCPEGTVSVLDPARDKCADCAAGFFNNVTGQSTCLACRPGQYVDQIAATACDTCDVGTFSDLGAIYCNGCKPGYYAESNGSSVCLPCELGRYVSVERATACESCPVAYVTRFLAGTSSDVCVCSEGYYKPLSRNLSSSDNVTDYTPCIPCPDGMRCPFGSDINNIGSTGPFPLTLPGYMTKPSDILQVWKCVQTKYCPGGPPGTCAVNRDPASIGCGECLKNNYDTNSGDCNTCEQSAQVLPIIGTIAIGLAFCVAAVVIVNRDTRKQTNAAVMVVSVIGIQLVGFQTLGIFSGMDIVWEEPVKTLLQLTRLVAFDFRVLRLQCVTGTKPVSSYLARQLAAPLAVCAIITLTAMKKGFRPRTWFFTEVCNTIGTLFNAMYISVIISCVLPYICINHPNGNGSSVLAYPSVLCQVSPEWSGMVAISAASFVVIAIPFKVMTAYAVWKYPEFMTRATEQNARRLAQFRFLFHLYQPRCYYFGILRIMKSLLIALVPVFTKALAVQITLLNTFLSAFVIIQMKLMPWKSPLINLLDAVSTNAIMLLLLTGAMSSNQFGDSASGDLQHLGLIFIIIFLIAVVAAFAYAVYARLIPRPWYDKFVCHHKAHAGAQARYLKILFQSCGRSCFIDSDDLVQLDSLFDSVKCQVGELVIYLTALTLTRPWCVGEVVSNFNAKKKHIIVKTPSFAPPTEEQYEHLDTYIDESGCRLLEYKITYEDCAIAIRNILKDGAPTILTVPYAKKSFMFNRLIADLTKSALSKDEQPGPIPAEDEAILISSDPEDDEATAGGGILLALMSQHIIHDKKVCRLCDCLPDSTLQLRSLEKAGKLIVLLSKDSMKSLLQLEAMVHCMIADERVITKRAIPVDLPGFCFPNETYFRGVLPGVWKDGAVDAELHIISFFKLISCSFNTMASEQVLMSQMGNVLQRIAGARKIMSASRSKSVLGSASTISGPRISDSVTQRTPKVKPSVGSEDLTAASLQSKAVAEIERGGVQKALTEIDYGGAGEV